MTKNILVIIDAQLEFITGALGNKEKEKNYEITTNYYKPIRK